MNVVNETQQHAYKYLEQSKYHLSNLYKAEIFILYMVSTQIHTYKVTYTLNLQQKLYILCDVSPIDGLYHFQRKFYVKSSSTKRLFLSDFNAIFLDKLRSSSTYRTLQFHEKYIKVFNSPLWLNTVCYFLSQLDKIELIENKFVCLIFLFHFSR